LEWQTFYTVDKRFDLKSKNKAIPAAGHEGPNLHWKTVFFCVSDHAFVIILAFISFTTKTFSRRCVPEPFTFIFSQTSTN
jgi:hypothetical protein